MSANIHSIKELVSHSSLCVLPWHGFALFPNGNIKNCAISSDTLGNIQSEPIDDILNNQKSVDVRHDMQHDHRHQRCVTCYRTEDLQDGHPVNKISNRIWYMKVLKNHDLSVYNHNNFVTPSVIDLRWRNTCNYACVYCGPDLSSRWAIERNKLSMFQTSEQGVAQVRDYVLDNVKSLKHVYLAGGEPLLIKENLELLQALKVHNPTVSIRINTNLSVVDNKIFQLLVEDFPTTKWTVSIDAIGEDYEYIRYPGNWDNFLKNLTYLYTKTQNIDYNFTWSVLNARTIFDAVDFLKAQFGCPDSVFVIQPIFIPRSLHIGNLPDRIIDELSATINERITKCDSILYKNSLQSMLSCLKIPVKKRLTQTVKFLDLINNKRSISLPQSLSYLYEEINHG